SVADQHNALYKRNLRPRILATHRGARADRCRSSQCFMPRDARQAVKVIKKPTRTSRTAVALTLVETRARIETEVLPTLGEDKEFHSAFRADGDVLLRPFRHMIHKHPGYQVCRFITQQPDSGLRTYGRRPPICSDNEPARQPMLNPIQLEAHCGHGPRR